MSQVVRVDSLESDRSSAIDGRSEFARRRDQAEREILLSALRESRETQSTLADHLGISPRTLRYRIARLRAVGLGVELP